MKHASRTRAAFIAFLFILLPAKAIAADRLRIGYGASLVTMSILWITKEGKLFAQTEWTS